MTIHFDRTPIPFDSWPVPSPRLTQKFGPTHNGVDLGMPVRTEIRAPDRGILLRVWLDEHSGGGLSMRVAYPQHRVILGFCHLSKVEVFPDSRIEKGDLLALSGGMPGEPNSGRSTGPHLHLAAFSYFGIETLDPLTIFPSLQEKGGAPK